MSPAEDKNEIKTIPPFPIRMIGPYTSYVTAVLSDGSIVTVSIDRDSWGTPEEPFIQVLIDRYTEARLPFPAHHRQDNCVRSVKDIDKAMSRILNRRPLPRSDAALEGNEMPPSGEGTFAQPGVRSRNAHHQRHSQAEPAVSDAGCTRPGRLRRLARMFRILGT